MKKNIAATGFTLLELMMTVGILGILSTMTVPSLVSVYNTQVDQSNASQALSIFKTARQNAISMRANTSIEWLNNEWIVKNTVDNSIITQQRINNTFQYSLIGLKTSSTNVTPFTKFGYTSAGVPYINGTLLLSGQSIFIGFSKKANTTITLAGSNTIGFIVDQTGSMYICKNTTDAQITQKCNT